MTLAPAIGANADDVVVLVDRDDVALGVAPKLQVHREGRLHRAVSVVLFDDRGRVLLQRRADEKYHSGGLWSNTCCGHPRPGEPVEDAATRRLRDELGIEQCDVRRVDQFVYFARLEGGLVEHELDHVVIGSWNGPIEPNSREVSDTRWVDRDQLLLELAAEPRRYTAWLHAVAYRASHRASASRSREELRRLADPQHRARYHHAP